MSQSSRRVYVPVFTVQLVRERRLPVEGTQVCHPDAAATVFRDYIGQADREHFVLMGLSTKNRVLGLTTVSVGSLEATIIHPREVFKAAILMNASGVIVAHNHPSGDPTPSPEDRDVTSRLVEAGKLLGVELLDHLVLGDNCYTSLRLTGML